MGGKVITYSALRPDWIANGNLMARALQRQLRAPSEIVTFVGFPRHWLPLFAWADARWKGSIEPPVFVPLVSGHSEEEVVSEIELAKAHGKLRLLVEVMASSEIVLCETLQRIDSRLAKRDFAQEQGNDIRLTTWHSYNRADVRGIDALICGFKQSRPGVMFIPCAKARPYPKSRAHQRLMRLAIQSGLDLDCFDKIVITSLGPIPEPYWELDLVQRYDTGVRDMYRLLVQARALLRNTEYQTAWDLMSFSPYSDLLRILHLEGYLPKLSRIESIRKRNVPLYRRISAAS